MQRHFIIIGAGGHAKVVADAVVQMRGSRVCGFLDNTKATGEIYCGYPILGDEGCLPAILQQEPTLEVVVAIGHNWHRKVVVERLVAACPTLHFGNVIHPRTSIARGATIGPGAVILAGAVIGPDVRVGGHAIVNHVCSVDHDSILEVYSSLAPGVVTGGLVSVDVGAAISTGAVLGRGVNIGVHAVIGAGSTVLHDVPAMAFAVGTPAHVVRFREVTDNYF